MMLAPLRTSLTFGILVALFHACWALLVLAGWAQPLMDFIFRLHFIAPPWTIAAFDWGTAALLVLVTGAVGAGFGLVFALVWNAAHRGRMLRDVA